MSFADGELDFILQQAAAGVAGALRVLEKQPPLEAASVFYWNALAELGTERLSSMNGPGPIPLSAMRAYCRDLNMTPYEEDLFKRVIMSVDSSRMALFAKKMESKNKKPL